MEKNRKPQLVTKNELEWVCLLEDGREITLQLEQFEDEPEENYIEETIKITFAVGDDVLGTAQDFFLFTRNGYAIAVEGQNYLLENIFLPSCLRGTGLSQVAIEFFKEYTGGAGIFAQHPFGQKINDGSDLLEPGQKFVRRMQNLGLILPYSI